MGDEQKSDVETPASITRGWWVFVGLLIAYPVSLVPLAIACRWGARLGFLPLGPTNIFLDLVTAPVFWLAESCRPVRLLVDWFINNVVIPLSG